MPFSSQILKEQNLRIIRQIMWVQAASNTNHFIYEQYKLPQWRAVWGGLLHKHTQTWLTVCRCYSLSHFRSIVGSAAAVNPEVLWIEIKKIKQASFLVSTWQNHKVNEIISFLSVWLKISSIFE